MPATLPSPGRTIPLALGTLAAIALAAPLGASGAAWQTTPLADSGSAPEVGATDAFQVLAAWREPTPDRRSLVGWARVQDGGFVTTEPIEPLFAQRVDVVPGSGAPILASRTSGQGVRGYAVGDDPERATPIDPNPVPANNLVPPATPSNTALLRTASSPDGTAIRAWVVGNRLLTAVQQPGTEWFHVSRPIDRNVIRGSITVAVSGRGFGVMAWAKERGDAVAIRAAQVTEQGRGFGRVRTVAVRKHATGRITIAPQGLVLWQESVPLRSGRSRPSRDAIYSRRYAGPRPLGLVNRVSPRWRITSRQFAPTLLAASGLVIWQTREGSPLFSAPVNNAGRRVGKIERVTGSARAQRPKLVEGAAGRLLVWDDYAQNSSRPGRILAAVSERDARQPGRPDVLGQAPAGGAPEVNPAATEAGFAVGWQRVSDRDPFRGGPAVSTTGS